MPEANIIDVACLCAAWCRTCDAYAPVMQQVAQELAASLAERGTVLRTHWIDIEDEADLVDDLDVETFPTLVVLDAQQVRFAGPLTPEPDTLRRMLRATLLDARDDARFAAPTAEVAALADRLRRR
jgi:thiol-disulfide isomerase/thioredoxin